MMMMVVTRTMGEHGLSLVMNILIATFTLPTVVVRADKSTTHVTKTMKERSLINLNPSTLLVTTI